MYKVVLTIAGFDGSSGAGLTADLKTFAALGCYGISILTAVPVQNTQGVKSCYQLPLKCLSEQFDNLISDIKPLSIKIGMLFNEEIVNLVSDNLQSKLSEVPLVLDPVMVAKSGHPLLKPEAVKALQEKMLPLATLVTPNLPEAEVLAGIKINSEDEILKAAEIITGFGPKAVLLKGGHVKDSIFSDAKDLLYVKGKAPLWLSSLRIKTKNDHGTGCTLSAAIAAYLALGYDLEESSQKAKVYLSKALKSAQNKVLGHGHGPVDHFFNFY